MLAILSVLFIGIVVLFPGPVLWILGPEYSHLQTQLFYSVVCGVIIAFTGLIFANERGTWLFGQVWLHNPSS
jgi:uncharacterized membrane protein YvlD (DUF360 family)